MSGKNNNKENIEKKPPKIFLNSLVNNASNYITGNPQPIYAKIIDANFMVNGEEWTVVEGLMKYYNNKDNLNLSVSEEKFIHNKYQNMSLYLRVQEVDSKKQSVIKLDKLEDIMSQLMEISKEEIDNLGKLKLKKDEQEYEKIRLAEKRNSCIHLINRYLNIYRQEINGREVIGFSKAPYSPPENILGINNSNN